MAYIIENEYKKNIRNKKKFVQTDVNLEFSIVEHSPLYFLQVYARNDRLVIYL